MKWRWKLSTQLSLSLSLFQTQILAIILTLCESHTHSLILSCYFFLAHNKRLQRHGSKRSNECDCSGNSLKLKQSTAFIHCQCRLFLLFQHSRSCLAKTMCWKKEFSMVLHEFHWVQWTAMHSVKWINVFKWNQISIWTRLILTSFFSGKFENDCIKNRCLRGNRKRMASVLL